MRQTFHANGMPITREKVNETILIFHNSRKKNTHKQLLQMHLSKCKLFEQYIGLNKKSTSVSKYVFQNKDKNASQQSNYSQARKKVHKKQEVSANKTSCF